MESARLHASPVGQLLVERGLMSQEQLEDALLEQRMSRKRLGAILVENRVVTAQDLTSALRAQVRAITDADPEPVEPTRPEAPARKRRLFRRQGSAEDSASSPLKATAERELLALTESQNDELRQELARQETDLEHVRTELGNRESRIAELELRLKTLEQEQAFLVEALRLEIHELERDLRAVATARSTRRGEVRTGPPARNGTVPVPPNATYLMLTPDTGGGHTLRECGGEAPPVGGEVEYGGRRYVVALHRSSPLGLDDRVCVHLQTS